MENYTVVRNLNLKAILMERGNPCDTFDRFFTDLAHYCLVSHPEQSRSEATLVWARNNRSSRPLRWLLTKGFIEKDEPELNPCKACGSTNIAYGTCYAYCKDCARGANWVADKSNKQSKKNQARLWNWGN